MLAVIKISNNSILSVVPDGTFVVEVGGLSVSPVLAGWQGGGDPVEDQDEDGQPILRNGPPKYKIMAVTLATIPDGKRAVGSPTYVMNGGTPTEVIQTEDIPVERRMVPKSIVQQRIIDLGLMTAARDALWSDANAWARWFAPDHPAVYFDDPGALALLHAIGADPAVIMAPGEE